MKINAYKHNTCDFTGLCSMCGLHEPKDNINKSNVLNSSPIK